MATSENQWFGVRCVFGQSKNQPWGPHDLRDGEYAYEERITLWQADSADRAIALAEEEAHLYEEQILVEYLGIAQCYRLGDVIGAGAEVFSLVRKSNLEPGPYLDAFFDTGSEYQAPFDKP